MGVRPISDRVLVKEIDEGDTTEAGIVMAGISRKTERNGDVIAVGPGGLLRSGERGGMQTKVGDRILYSKFVGTEIKIDGVVHQIMHESDILGTVPKYAR